MDSFDGVADFLDKISDAGYSGFNVYKKLLNATGSVKGVITTTRMDCLSRYKWKKVLIAYRKESGVADYIDSSQVEEDLWKAWQDGWRPGLDEYFLMTHQRF